MKKIIGIISLVLFYSIAFTQNKSEEILNKTSKKIKSYNNIIAEFDFMMKNEEENIKENYKGKLYLKKEKYFLDLMDVNTYFDGEKIYTYLIEANEVTISKPEEDNEDFLNPAKIFTIFESGFNSKFKKSTKNYYSIDLFPIDEDKEFSKINIKIDKKTYHPIVIKTYGKDGNDIILNILTFNTETLLDDSKFTFDFSKYKDVETIDMQ